MATPAKKPSPPAAAAAVAKGAGPDSPVTPPARKKRAGKLIRISIALVAAIGAGGGGWFYLQHKNADAKAAPAVQPKKQPVFLPIDQFTVNVPGGGGEHFLQIAFSLEVVDSKTADAIKLQLPIIRGRLLMLLASKAVEDLSNTAGKQKLIGEILVEARAPLPAGETPTKGVENVHFSAFVIQ